ncbi:MAG: radical SAM protein [Endomicrobia bacterium]|nr:radical SAM protein [Endomicrobiia bacterium]
MNNKNSTINKKSALLINPPVYDFTAFDLWSKPLGLLYLSSILKQQNVEVEMLDYMDRHFAGSVILRSNKVATKDPGLDSSGTRFPQNDGQRYGCGHYLKTHVPKPAALKHVPRHYSRYGILKETAKSRLRALKRPDLIIVTSIMTYWYPGVIEAIESVRNVFPNVPVALGGVYATLCPKHALETAKPDFLVQGGLASLNEVFEQLAIPASVQASFACFPAPDYTYYNRCSYVALRMSMGCPFNCSYCAQRTLCADTFTAKTPERVFEEIAAFAAKGIENIVFYDDALLYDADKYIKPLLRKIIASGMKINIHTPNGLHLRYLDLELASLMKKGGFASPRFSLESADARLQNETGAKITNEGFERAVAILKQAGFKNGEFTIYLLMGMPGQSLKDVEESIKYVHSFGGRVSLSEYSVVPGTKDFQRQLQITNYELQIKNNKTAAGKNYERQLAVSTNSELLRGAKQRSNLDFPNAGLPRPFSARNDGQGRDFANEPLLHNKSVFPLFETKDWQEIMRIKNLATKLNALTAED